MRAGIKLGIRDPTLGDGMIGLDQSVERRRQRVLIDGVRARDVEIESPFLGADLAARDREFHQRGEQMQRRVHAHVLEALLPVEHGADGSACRRRRRALARHMDDGGLVGVVDGG